MNSPDDLRALLQHAVEHLDHVLPGQAPILNFVHHNTLHGYQHLPFAEALRAAEQVSGIYAYQSETVFRRYYAEGRIDADDVNAALNVHAELDADALAVQLGARRILRRDVLRAVLLHGADALTAAQLNWRLDHAPPDTALWSACLDVLGLEHAVLHAEELTDLSQEHAEAWLDAAAHNGASVHQSMRQHMGLSLEQTLSEVGVSTTWRDLMRTLSGCDLLDWVRPTLIRYLGAYLDEGWAAWRLPDCRLGFYAAWRQAATNDALALLEEFSDWQTDLAALPEAAVDAVAASLQALAIPPTLWAGYIERLALELPGWAGLVNWRQQRPDYPANQHAPAELMDVLAVRLFLDRQWLKRHCRTHWKIDARLDALDRYFSANLSEFLVRSQLYRAELPEYLAIQAARLLDEAHSERSERPAWRALANQIWTWRHSPAGQHGPHTAQGNGWRLLSLAQSLDLNAAAVQQLGCSGALALLSTADALDRHTRGSVWLHAYERHYREQIFHALTANHGRGAWAQRATRPAAQVIFCMDDREESLRRHLEELNPAIETLGAAGFFGVPMEWRALDDVNYTALCPVVVTPSHRIDEQPRPDAAAHYVRHQQRRGGLQSARQWFYHTLRRGLLSPALGAAALAPALLPTLLGKTFWPYTGGRLSAQLGQRYLPELPTQLNLSAIDDGRAATPQQPRQGFTDQEQAERVAGFLRTVGLTHGFAPWVVLSGHGSISQNNPHLAAYDCGACSGRHGGPNARVFAAMANRPEVRRLLAARGIDIPADTYFIGTEHNTANENLIWYDLDALPNSARATLAPLQAELEQARRWSAHERCRRLASAPRRPSLAHALAHMIGRTQDFSQARPELGHATNATAFIGRRSLSRGAFFDRRAFLISYDPTQDPQGNILENILLAAGPVGAGINLEYYFSSVDNERFGCGTKVPHNVVGHFAVMEGASSDLRTGLPRQMIEIHEAMRLLVITEHQPEVVAAIYARQAPLRELIGNAWIQVATLDPDNGRIWLFDPRDETFQPWTPSASALPEVECSSDWYQGHSAPLPPALLRRSVLQ